MGAPRKPPAKDLLRAAEDLRSDLIDPAIAAHMAALQAHQRQSVSRTDGLLGVKGKLISPP